MFSFQLCTQSARSSLQQHLAVVAVIFGCACAIGQEKPAAENLPAGSQKPDLESLPPGFHLIHKDAATRGITVHQDVAPQILKDVQDRHLNQKRSEVFDLQKLEIKATVDGELVRLNAELLVDIEQDNEWVRVPVGFDSFHLTDLEHSTAAPNGAGRFEKKGLPRKTWLLFGKGEHRIRLELIGRIRVSSSQRHRIQLFAPDATLSRLLMTCPRVIESVELSSGKPFHLRVNEQENSSEVETWGLQADSEISWLPRPESKDESVTIQSVGTTTMTLDFTTASMTVRQPLAVSGGSISELAVSIPSDFVAASIRGTDSEGRNVVAPATDKNDSNEKIRFAAPVAGPVILEYDLGLRSTEYPQNISIQIPRVEGLSSETADLEIFVPVGLEVDVEVPDENRARQKRVESARTQRTPVVAYRLLSGDAKLNLAIRETEAFYSINPLISLETERNTILLTARFAVNMVRGSLTEMEVKWPEFREEGWTILDVQMQLPQDDSTTPVARIDSEDAFRVSFPGRQSGQFEIEVQAARDLASFQEGDSLLFLPGIEAPTPHTTTVSLIESDAFSMTLAARDGRIPFPSLPASRLPKEIQNRKSPLSAWLVDAVDETVELQITPQQSEVRASVLGRLSIANDNIHVSEVISFDVRHRDLSELVLNVPGVTPTVRLEGEDESLIGTAAETDTLTYALPRSLRGKFQVYVDFYWAPDTAAEPQPGTTVELPIVLPDSSSQLNDVTIATSSPESLVIDRNAGWTRIHSDEFAAAWLADGRPAAVPVTLQHSLQSQPGNRPDFLVLKSVVHASELATSVTAVFSRPTDTVMFTLENGTTAHEGYIGEQRVRIEEIARDDNRTTVLLAADRSTGIRQTTHCHAADLSGLHQTQHTVFDMPAGHTSTGRAGRPMQCDLGHRRKPAAFARQLRNPNG